MGLYSYDYGARYYDPSLGRFHSIDPLAEEYKFQSPFLYAYNNPIRFTDYLGMGAEDEVEKETETNSGITITYNGDAEGEGNDYVQETSTTTTTTTFPGDHESSQSQTVATTTQTTVVVDADGVSENATQVTTSTVTTTDKYGNVTTSDPIVNSTVVKTSETSSTLQSASQFANDFRKDNNGQSIVQAVAADKTNNIKTVGIACTGVGIGLNMLTYSGAIAASPVPGARAAATVVGAVGLGMSFGGLIATYAEKDPNNITVKYKK